MISYISDVNYHDIVISDHSPITFKLQLDDISPRQPIWRFDPELLKDPRFCEYFRTQISIFLEDNDTPDTQPSLLWETLKAFMTGCIISYKGMRNKQKRAILQQLERKIQQLDSENAASPSLDLHDKILPLRLQYSRITSQRIRESISIHETKIL